METISDPEITIHLNTVETEAVDITKKQIVMEVCQILNMA